LDVINILGGKMNTICFSYDNNENVIIDPKKLEEINSFFKSTQGGGFKNVYLDYFAARLSIYPQKTCCRKWENDNVFADMLSKALITGMITLMFISKDKKMFWGYKVTPNNVEIF
jgi:hypothetical protein